MNRSILLGAILLTLWSLGAGKKNDAYVEWWNGGTTYPSNVTYLAPTDSTDPPKIKIEGTDQPTTTTVATIDHPPIGTSDYQLLGQVWYTGVRGQGYLEMWSYFADGNAYFTKAIDVSGPLQSLSGDSNWRSFALPFHAQRGIFPTKIVVNVVLPGKGTVKLSPLTLAPIVARGEWWSSQTVGWIGAILGSLFGCLGGLIGLLSSRGRAPRFVLAAMVFMIAAAAVMLVAGGFAIALRQPWAVYYPLLLCGGLVLVVMLCQFPVIKRRYAELELRKMTAMDLPA